MDISELVNIVSNRNKTFRTLFHKTCLEHLNKFESTHKIHEIPEWNHSISGRYLVEAVKLYMTENYNKYRFYLCKVLIPGTIYRKITLTDNGKRNLFKQIHIIKSKSIDSVLSDEYMEYYQKFESDSMIFVASENILSDTEFEVELDDIKSVLLFLGIETFDMLNHQNMDGFISYFKSKKRGYSNSVNHYYELFEAQKEFDNETRERIIIFSGFTLQILGAIYTSDIDIIYYNDSDDNSRKHRIKNMFNRHGIFDYKIIDNDYKNIHNVLNIMSDPAEYFYFLGYKVMSVGQVMQRAYMRSAPSSYVDLIRLNMKNGYKIDLCLPNIVMMYDKVTVNDVDGKVLFIKTMQKKLSDWYSMNIESDVLDKMIRTCNDPNHESMITVGINEPILEQVGKVMFGSNTSIISEYFDKSNVIIFGSNKLRDLKIYDSHGTNCITVIETSKDQTVFVEEKVSRKKTTHDIKIDILNISESDVWNKQTHEIIFNSKPYNNMMFDNTVHMYYDNYERLVKNISSVDSRTTVIAITFIDGDKVDKILKNANRYEIKNNKTILFGIYRFNDGTKNKIAVYINGANNYDKGLVQVITKSDDLIKLFQSIDYKPVRNSNMLSMSKLTDLPPQCREICSMFRVIIFRKT